MSRILLRNELRERRPDRVEGDAGVAAVRVRLTHDDVHRIRLALSPLTELALSFYLLRSGRFAPEQRAWLAAAAARLDGLDLEPLQATIPVEGEIADFYLAGVSDADTSIERQLDALAALPAARLRADLAESWSAVTGSTSPTALPDDVRRFTDRAAGRERLHAALAAYWATVLAPSWDRFRAVLDADIAHRSAGFGRAGVRGLVDDLHPRIHLIGDELRVEPAAYEARAELAGHGLVLVPSVFLSRLVLIRMRPDGDSFLGYPARGHRTAWTAPDQLSGSDAGPLADLVGRGRSAVLRATGLPTSTQDLARLLGQSPATVSEHLSVLRRSGLVESRRAGRRVLYTRTELGTAVVNAAP